MGVRASEEWLEEYRNENPDRVNDGHSAPVSGAGGNNTHTTGATKGAQHSPQARRVRLQISAVPPSLNELLRTHWAERHRLKKAWWALVRAEEERGVCVPARLTYTRVSPGTLDIDNLYASAKVVIDALVYAGILPDDDPGCLSEVIAKQKTCSQGEGHTILELTSV